MNSVTATISLDKTMTLSEREFAKSMAAFAGRELVVTDGRVSLAVGEGQGRADITYTRLPSRRVGGLLELPQARVTITLTGVTADEVAHFQRRFDIAFQRGGG